MAVAQLRDRHFSQRHQRVTDAHGLTYDEQFVVSVINANEPVGATTDTNAAADAVAEIWQPARPRHHSQRRPIPTVPTIQVAYSLDDNANGPLQHRRQRVVRTTTALDRRSMAPR